MVEMDENRERAYGQMLEVVKAVLAGQMQASNAAELLSPISSKLGLDETREEPSEPSEPSEASTRRSSAPRVITVPLLFRRLLDRSTGYTNDSLVSHLVESGAIAKSHIEAAFRAVDRGKFLPNLEEGTSEAKVRFGHFHMSQPSLYAEAVANLDLSPGLSFLNVGSGTGYLSSIVSEITGPALHHGVDLYSDLLDHAQDASVLWANNDGQLGANITLKECVSSIELQDMLRVQNKEYIQFFEVNAHDLDLVMCPRYDRMYLGACAGGQSKRLLALLQVGGVAVGPFETSSGQYIRRVLRTSLGQCGDMEEWWSAVMDADLCPRSETTFDVKNLKQVSFGRLLPSEEPLRRPSFVLPSPPWTPSTHAAHSKGFRNAVREVLLSTTRANSPAHIVPRDIFVKHVFGFMHPRWFSSATEDPFRERLDGADEQPMDDEGTYDEDSARLQVLRTLAMFARQQRDLEAQDSDDAMRSRIQSLFRMLNPNLGHMAHTAPDSDEDTEDPPPERNSNAEGESSGGYPAAG
eukprot:s783_g19.t1